MSTTATTRNKTQADQRTRLQLRQRIHTCTSCALHTTCTKPVPLRGPAPATIAVIGEAPGREEDEQNKPFVGASGKWVQRSLDALFPQGDVAFLNTVSCRPPNNRDPFNSEIDACRPNMMAQLELIDPKVTILLGRIALNVFRPTVKISNVHGVPFWKDGRVFLPTYHPAYGLRNPKAMQEIARDFHTAVLLATTDDWPEQCWKCGAEVERYDQLGIPWCVSDYLTALKDGSAEV